MVAVCGAARILLGRSSRLQGAAHRYATATAALDPRASTARLARKSGQPCGLPRWRTPHRIRRCT